MEKKINTEKRLPAPNWISFKDNPPPLSCLTYVMNAKGWMRGRVAWYQKTENVFVLKEKGEHDGITLEVTHWHWLPN